MVQNYLKDLTEQAGANYRFEYSPESFTGTEPEFALEVCNGCFRCMATNKRSKSYH